MGLFSKGNKIKALVLKNNCTAIEIKDLTKKGNTISDPNMDAEYTATESPLQFHNGKKSGQAYVIDEDSGATLSLKKDDSVLNLKTNPQLMGNVMGGKVLEKAFQMKPERKTLFAVLFVGVILGFFIGAMF